MKKTILFFLCVVQLLGILCGCGHQDTSSEPIETPVLEQKTENDTDSKIDSNETLLQESYFDLDAFKREVQESRKLIGENAICLSNMGNYEINYWKALGKYDSEITERAFSWLEKKSDYTREYVESNHDSIRQQYKNIILADTTGKEATLIAEAYESLYTTYCKIYDLVTSPSGTLESFSNNLLNLINEYTTAENNLALFLDD